MKQINRIVRWNAMVFALLLLLPLRSSAQRVDLRTEAYIQPPKEIADLVTAPRHLNVTLQNLSPDGKHFIIPKDAGLPTLKIYAKPFVNLGEREFDYNANRDRRFTLRRQLGFEIFNWETGKRIVVAPPKNGWTSNPTWSPDGKMIAYFGHTDKETHIYVADAFTGKSKRITQTPVLATLVTSFEWSQDSRNILTVLVPSKRKPMPQKSTIATEPKVRITNNGKTPNRTYPNLLQTPYDKALLEWLATGQMAQINVKTRKVHRIAEPAMFTSLDLSPDGRYILATTMQKPFAYTVPIRSFGSQEKIYDVSGKVYAVVQEQKIRYSTIRTDSRQNNREQNRKRSIQWRPDGNGLSYLEMEPRKKRGNADQQEISEEEDQKRYDRLIQWLPPFDSTSIKVIYRSKTRINSVNYSQDCNTLFISQTESGKQHIFAVELSDTSKKFTIAKYRTSDIYKHPGSLVTRRGKRGGTVIRMTNDGAHVFMAGTRYSKNPLDTPPVDFLYKLNFKTGERDTLFLGTSDVYEAITSGGFSFRRSPGVTTSVVADESFEHIFTVRQSPTMVPDSYVRNLKTGDLKKLTNNKDYSPEITQAKRYRFQIKRVDGFKFWVQITLPPDYKEGTKLPAMFWFYPREFTSQKNYDQSAARYNKNLFPRVYPRSMEFLTRLGYAVVQPDCPIVGPSGRMNDNYVPDLRNNLWAVIDFLDKKGFIDRDRLAIGGHSYGAFGTANALIHTPFFKAGIAGDGNYNRSLTPITFQNERRYLWDAREVYIRMSPLFWANQLNGALLMYHGMDDNNVGTFLINSERMFHVLDGLGKKAALYIYPYEHHGPATKETLLDLWARWIQWLDKYVKNPQEEKKEKEKKSASRG